MSNAIKLKRVYETAAPEDGTRILVDRLWPRGISKASAQIDHWMKEVSPSHDLRRWFKHEAPHWEEFLRRYFAELDANPEAVAALRERIDEGPVTLLYAAKNTDLNNAKALALYLQKRKR